MPEPSSSHELPGRPLSRSYYEFRASCWNCHSRVSQQQPWGKSCTKYEHVCTAPSAVGPRAKRCSNTNNKEEAYRIQRKGRAGNVLPASLCLPLRLPPPCSGREFSAVHSFLGSPWAQVFPAPICWCAGGGRKSWGSSLGLNAAGKVGLSWRKSPSRAAAMPVLPKGKAREGLPAPVPPDGYLPGSLGALMGYPRGTPGCWPPKPPNPERQQQKLSGEYPVLLPAPAP